MQLKELDVFVERRDSGTLSARVMQQNSEGRVFGKEILSQRSITDYLTAEKLITEKLSRYAIKINIVFDHTVDPKKQKRTPKAETQVPSGRSAQPDAFDIHMDMYHRTKKVVNL